MVTPGSAGFAEHSGQPRQALGGFGWSGASQSA